MSTYVFISWTTHFFLFVICLLNDQDEGSWDSKYAYVFYVMWVAINGICIYEVTP
jgi:hypothetical protein